MCGRYTLTNKEEVKSKYNIDIDPNYNISPSSQVFIITSGIQKLKWSYSPTWAKKPMNLINARYETINEKPSFKNARRCAFIMDGWYEWKRYFNWNKREHVKDPYYHHIDNKLFFVAGLYNDSGCVCVTKNSVKPISDIHHRQPLLLEESQLKQWMNGDHIIKDTVSSKVKIHKVSTYVNSPQNNDLNCIQAI